MNRLHMATRDGARLSAIPHRLNIVELSWEEFWYNLRLKYGIMTQDILATCDGCCKKLLIKHALSCQKGGLVLEQHEYSAKDLGALGSQALTPSAIS